MVGSGKHYKIAMSREYFVNSGRAIAFIKKHLCSTVVPRISDDVETMFYVLSGRDCMGCAKTGSGKTAAFVLPVLQKLSEDPYGIFCLVLTPTRSVLIKDEPKRQNPNRPTEL